MNDQVRIAQDQEITLVINGAALGVITQAIDEIPTKYGAPVKALIEKQVFAQCGPQKPEGGVDVGGQENTEDDHGS